MDANGREQKIKVEKQGVREQTRIDANGREQKIKVEKKEFFSRTADGPDQKNEAFERWLIDICTDEKITYSERTTRLVEWNQAPFAKYCHPREEHLLPLHVCFGLSKTAGKLVFDEKIGGKKTCGFQWQFYIGPFGSGASGLGVFVYPPGLFIPCE